jgi:hypothetical protein
MATAVLASPPATSTTRARAEHELATLARTPLTLPRRADGRPLRHLSASSYTLWQTCEEQWRRRYLLGEPTPTTPAMFLGTAVDAALGWMYRQQIDGNSPEPGDVADAYERLFDASETDRRRVSWTEQDSELTIREQGRRCVELYLVSLAPLAGRPVAVQREISVKLHPDAKWTITGYIDLETIRDVPVAITDGGLVIPVGARPPDDHRVVGHSDAGVRVVEDYRVKGEYVSKSEADGAIEPGVYLLDRRLGPDPAEEFVFANLVRPGKKRASFGARLLRTRRTDAQLRGVMLRFAQMAREISERVAEIGYERPWKFADPGRAFPCRRAFCAHAKRCPGWSGV